MTLFAVGLTELAIVYGVIFAVLLIDHLRILIISHISKWSYELFLVSSLSARVIDSLRIRRVTRKIHTLAQIINGL